MSERAQAATQKRLQEARLLDEILFQQPESNFLGDCPICCLPLSLDPKKINLDAMLQQTDLIGCEYANIIREFEVRLDPGSKMSNILPAASTKNQ